jgi:Arf-GAP/SH3 domain/ANK repeat/PH domain-containing protein
VDFLIQNMSNSAIDKATSPPSSLENYGSNTALHLCAIYDKVECMKLLLRSGANANLKNSQNKTPMDIAQELGHHTCEELVRFSSTGLKQLMFVLYIYFISIAVPNDIYVYNKSEINFFW